MLISIDSCKCYICRSVNKRQKDFLYIMLNNNLWKVFVRNLKDYVTFLICISVNVLVIFHWFPHKSIGRSILPSINQFRCRRNMKAVNYNLHYNSKRKSSPTTQLHNHSTSGKLTLLTDFLPRHYGCSGFCSSETSFSLSSSTFVLLSYKEL